MGAVEHGGAPAPRPCGSCPYRCDVPSGVWAEDEYRKLPEYDAVETAAQPPAAFFCHQQDGRLCAGWVAVHDMTESLGLRMAAGLGRITPEAASAALTYETDVPVFASGAEAASHGLRDLLAPGAVAVKVIGRLAAKKAGEDVRRDDLRCAICSRVHAREITCAQASRPRRP